MKRNRVQTCVTANVKACMEEGAIKSNESKN